MVTKYPAIVTQVPHDKLPHSLSAKLFKRACKLIPGGVNSPVRAFKGLGQHPVFFNRGKGAKLYDEDGNDYLDYVCSWGALITGHVHPHVVNMVMQTIRNGMSFGTPTELEVRMAEKLSALMPSLGMVRMVNSGTEAAMSAIRLARGYTQREKVVKFAGCYHGHSDSLLASAGSGVSTLGIPDSPGVTAAAASDTIVLDYNDSRQAEVAFEQYGREIAAVIVEPIAGNMNLIPADKRFLQHLRLLCNQSGSVLIFDEVMSGFRVALGGAQALYSIQADLTTLGKVIGGGMPIGAFGGSSKIMQELAPSGGVYQAGTLSGNPVAMAAGIATLELIETKRFFESLTQKTAALSMGLATLAKEHRIPFHSNYCGGMFGFSFTDEPARNFTQTARMNLERFKRFYRAMLQKRIYLAPSAFEAGFVSSAHSEQDIAATLVAADESMHSLR